MKICQRCGNTHERKRSKYCCNECGAKFTDDRKKALSKARSDFLRNNPEKHPWKRSDKFKSIPCEKLKEFLREENILFVEEWIPLTDRNFSIDIAFPDIMFGIEVNGNQHYNSDGTLKSYYQERHQLIESAGWKLLELHYSSCFDKTLLKTLIEKREQPDYREYFEIQKMRKLSKKTEAPGVKAFRKTEIKMRPKIEKLLSSDIDFSSFGWVNKASVILGVKPQKVHIHMKRFASEFYEHRCFKRKSSLVGK
jgi:hypothetical protein